MVLFVPNSGRSTPGGFVETDDPAADMAKLKVYERLGIRSLNLRLEIFSLTMTSDHLMPGYSVRATKTISDFYNEIRHWRAIIGTGKITPKDDPYRVEVKTVSQLGTGLKFSTVAVSLVDVGSSEAGVKFFVWDKDGASIDLKVSTTWFDQTLSDIKIASGPLVMLLELRDCVGCLTEWSPLPGGKVDMKFLASYQDVKNDQNIPSEFFSSPEFGSGAHVKIIFQYPIKQKSDHYLNLEEETTQFKTGVRTAVRKSATVAAG
ncbi:MAG: hypothetical protein ABIY70_16260 [Capsulimonas sp.]|uniref:hypothetical protein n=1 Tax=Capsulimonas sp. TaxID=2494211 RepID=UPI003265BA3F